MTKHIEHESQVRTWLGERGVRGAAADLGALARPLSAAAAKHRLLPCLAWHDSTHVASVAFYRRLFQTEMSILGFIESGLGPRQAADAVALGLPAFVHKWKTWVVDDGVPAAMVGHLDGSSLKGRTWARPQSSTTQGESAYSGRGDASPLGGSRRGC